MLEGGEMRAKQERGKLLSLFPAGDCGDQVVGFHISGDDCIVLQYNIGRSVDVELLAELQVVVNLGAVAFCRRKLLAFHCVVKRLESPGAVYALGLRVSLFVHRKREELYEKYDVFSLFNNLLHLQMKFLAVWSVDVAEDYHLVFSCFVAHHDCSIDRYLSEFNLRLE